MIKILSKNLFKFCKILPLILGIFYLSGCATYTASALSNLSADLFMNSIPKSGDIGVAARPFTKADCRRYLDRDVISEGYQPVQIFLQNNTEKKFSFSLSRINLPHASPEEVAEKVHTSTVGRAVGYGAGALLLWPLAIPAIIDGVMSYQANKALDNDFYSKAAKDQTLNPHSYINTLIFVPSSCYTNNFSIILIDQETNKPVVLNVSA